jgi:hypothetical protein
MTGDEPVILNFRMMQADARKFLVKAKYKP